MRTKVGASGGSRVRVGSHKRKQPFAYVGFFVCCNTLLPTHYQCFRQLNKARILSDYQKRGVSGFDVVQEIHNGEMAHQLCTFLHNS